DVLFQHRRGNHEYDQQHQHHVYKRSDVDLRYGGLPVRLNTECHELLLTADLGIAPRARDVWLLSTTIRRSELVRASMAPISSSSMKWQRCRSYLAVLSPPFRVSEP